MGSAYGISDCLGWYLAGAGVFTDAGVTPAQDGEPVSQWNDQSGAGNHLSQAVAADRPVFTSGQAPAGVTFDSAGSTAMNLPASLALPADAVTVLLCTRGSGAALLGLGSISYGAVGVGGELGVVGADGTFRGGGLFLPEQHPVVHGFLADADGATLRWGTTRSTAASAVTMSSGGGGVLGRSPGSTAGFTGDVLELAIFDRALTSAEAQTVLAGMQVSNGLPADADANLLLLIGDEQIAGAAASVYWQPLPFWLDRGLGGAYCPLQIAAAGQTCAAQQTTLAALQAEFSFGVFPGVVAVICCGVNDVLLDDCTGDAVISRFTALVETVRSTTGIRVIAAVPLLSGDAGASGAQLVAIESFRSWLRAGAGGAADAVVDWTADARLSDTAPQPVFRSGTVETTVAGSRVKAALIEAAIGSSPAAAAPSTSGALTFGAFYAGGRTYAGTFGNFVQG